ncbi:MAG TPA: S8 family serine peptidase, partial [Beijerinckiaceae bacterium]|nr:S8 family serine peptidase [Beijerinckiaceae bacterium]
DERLMYEVFHHDALARRRLASPSEIRGGAVPAPRAAPARRAASARSARPVAAARARPEEPRRTARRPRPATVAARDAVPAEVLLQLRPAAEAGELARVAARHRLRLLESADLTLVGPVHRLRIADARPVAAVVRALQRDRGVAAAQPNFVFTLQQGASKAADEIQYAVAKLRLREAHRLSKGSGVLVALIDSRMDEGHPEFAAAATEVVELGPQARPHPHGTAMAGAILARGKLLGASPEARLLAIAAFAGAAGAEASSSSLQVLKALDRAHGARAKIASLSFAGPHDPLLGRGVARARAEGMILVAAAGNRGDARPLYPAADPNVIAVSATDAADRPYARASRGRHVAVAAPGVDVLVAAPGGGYGQSSGTSIAAAHVAGVLALAAARRPNLSPEEARALLRDGARSLAGGDPERVGAGIVDAAAALERGPRVSLR